jgi:hypothetical protein
VISFDWTATFFFDAQEENKITNEKYKRIALEDTFFKPDILGYKSIEITRSMVVILEILVETLKPIKTLTNQDMKCTNFSCLDQLNSG